MIAVKDLSKTFEYTEKEVGLKNSVRNLIKPKKLEKKAVNGVSFHIDEGEIVGFLGPNGAGKTTTLKMLSGILHPTSGSAEILGYVPWERKNAYKKQFSIVMGQKNQLWWDLPANESLYLNKCIYQIPDQRYNEMLDLLTETLDVKDFLKIQVRRLSLGERMKLELIAALLHEPKVLFLDEPTIGLDLISQKKIRGFIEYFNLQYKTTILLTSHYMHDIENLCKRTIVINQGEVVYDGKITEISKELSNQKIIRLSLDQQAIGLKDRIIAPDLELKSYADNVLVYTTDKEKVREHAQNMLSCLPVIDLTIEDTPLEDAIALLYGKDVNHK